MHRLTRITEHVFRTLTGLSFAVIGVAVVLQLMGRNGLMTSVVWTEEISRFALLYIAALGAGLAFRSGDMVNVDLVSESLPGRAPWVLRLLSAVATLVGTLALIAPAWRFTSIGARQTAPASGIRMDLVHGAVLVVMVGLALFALLRIIGMLRGSEDGRPHRPEEEI
ncbi:TRAP transporter small permease [Falsirhodobacter algicola]|uniref:TRAP transporter small permease protein n=1 Tax=Falsirhodobacter algicola TaxID=2692330 RepID=A0A8J8MTL8_9RHOB|nr:TRAP transporter small permease [Falsirhodobacter algicola]QUS36229.1 TRAP transporter small permease subunit [Falsirhodobacter algicola]